MLFHMMIGILQCDHIRCEMRAEYGDFPMMIQRLLIQVAPSHSFKIYDVTNEQYPVDIDECDAYITTGSKASIYDDEQWIKTFQHFVLALHKERKKLVGLCFGHQMIAQALNGQAGKAVQGWGVGVHTSNVILSKPWMQPQQSTVKLLVSHQDQVSLLPDGGQLLASNDFCANSIYQIDNHILGIQGHPEYCKNYVAALMYIRSDSIGEQKVSEGMASLAEATDELLVGKWIINFMKK